MPVIEQSPQNCNIIHPIGIGSESNNLQSGFHPEPKDNIPAMNRGPVPKHNGKFDQVQSSYRKEDIDLILSNSSETCC